MFSQCGTIVNAHFSFFLFFSLTFIQFLLLWRVYVVNKCYSGLIFLMFVMFVCPYVSRWCLLQVMMLCWPLQRIWLYVLFALPGSHEGQEGHERQDVGQKANVCKCTYVRRGMQGFSCPYKGRRTCRLMSYKAFPNVYHVSATQRIITVNSCCS